MDIYLERLKKQPLCGIEACYWLDFFKIFQEHSSEEKIRGALARLRKKAAGTVPGDPGMRQTAILHILDELERLVEQD